MLEWVANSNGGRAIDAGTVVSGMARLKHGLEAYYALTYQPARRMDAFTPLKCEPGGATRSCTLRQVSGRRLAVVARIDPGSSQHLTDLASRASTKQPDRCLGGIDSRCRWRTQMVISWEPRSHGGLRAAGRRADGSACAAGTVLFDGRRARSARRRKCLRQRPDSTSPRGASRSTCDLRRRRQEPGHGRP